MDVSLLIRHRLDHLGLDQRNLAAAAQVTESYISQLLTRKKVPPAPGRTDIYEKIGGFLQLPQGELAKLAELQRRQEWKKRLADPPKPLYEEWRELILRKCEASSRAEVERIFEREPFGELERLVSHTLLDAAQSTARKELENEEWLRLLAEKSERSYEEMRVVALEFLDTDVFHVSLDNCVTFLDPVIKAWDINLRTFAIDVELNRRLAPRRMKRFKFTEQPERAPDITEPGFDQFLGDKLLSGDATVEEMEFLRRLKFNGRHPTPLYYYRELQNLRDPLHFARASD